MAKFNKYKFVKRYVESAIRGREDAWRIYEYVTVRADKGWVTDDQLEELFEMIAAYEEELEAEEAGAEAEASEELDEPESQPSLISPM